MPLVRIGFGLVWLADAWDAWQPAFRREYWRLLVFSTEHQPAALHGWLRFWGRLVEPHVLFFAFATAVLETLLGLCLVLGLLRRQVYPLGATLALVLWTTLGQATTEEVPDVHRRVHAALRDRHTEPRMHLDS